MSNEECFSLVAGLSGKLLCVNRRLVAEPQLLWTRPHDMGYLVILAMQRKEHAALQQLLSTAPVFAQEHGFNVDMLQHCGTFSSPCTQEQDEAA